MMMSHSRVSTNFALFLICCGGCVLYFIRNDFVLDSLSNNNVQVAVTKTKDTRSSDVIILGYHRDGSRVVSNILGMKPEVFYIYEPLYVQGKTIYFKPGYSCDALNGNCRVINADKKVENILHALNRCDFYSIQNELNVWSFKQNQTATDHIRLTKLDEDDVMSVKNLEYLCDGAAAKVTKLLRASMRTLKWLLDVHPSLKIIHFIRDPRGIIHSRKAIWKTETSMINKAANALCTKMNDDARESEILQEKYPGRIITLYFEDILENPIKHMKALYTKLQWKFSPEDEINVKAIIGGQHNLDRGIRWRYTMSHRDVFQINKACKNVYNKFRYPELKTAAEMKNLNILPRFL